MGTTNSNNSQDFVCLSATAGLHNDSLSTLLCIVENIINSRPLTLVSDDPDDFEPLTSSSCGPDLLLLRVFSRNEISIVENEGAIVG